MTVPGTEIRFYRSNERPWGAFSNLYRSAVTFEGREFPTAEHAYQFGKPKDFELREWLMLAPTPSALACAAHALYPYMIVEGWHGVKVARMRRVLCAKFGQSETLRDLLLSTEDARIVEAGRSANRVNLFWGEVEGKGKNVLGRLLMELRTAFREGNVGPELVAGMVLAPDHPLVFAGLPG